MVIFSAPSFFYDYESHPAERQEFLEAQIDLAIKMGYEAHVYDIEKLDYENQFGPTWLVEAEYYGADAAAAKEAARDNPYVEFVGKDLAVNGIEFKVGQACVF